MIALVLCFFVLYHMFSFAAISTCRIVAIAAISYAAMNIFDYGSGLFALDLARHAV